MAGSGCVEAAEVSPVARGSSRWSHGPAWVYDDAMHDLVISDALLVDGTKAPARHGDVAVTGGRIVEVGREVGPGRQEIDAGGLALAPGIIDTHTHYDAQITWDPGLTPSPAHGVTTVVIGNCGFN